MVAKVTPSHFSQALKALRQQHDLPKYQVFTKSGIDKALYYRLESGGREPTPEALDKLEAVFTKGEVAQLREARLKDLAGEVGAQVAHPPADLPPEQAAEQLVDQGREWVRIHQRSGKRTPEQAAKFWEAIRAVAEAELKMQKEEREDRSP
jgi:transcriptional regulator with XRE-family HTH domain